MIKQFIFIFFLLFSLVILPSCTIFGGGVEEDMETEEDYYPTAEDPESEELDNEGPTEETQAEEEPGALEEQDTESSENVQYIDEEDEDLLEEDGSVIVSDTAEYNDGLNEESYDPTGDNTSAGDSSSDFFDPSSQASADGKENPAPPQKKQWISYKKIKSQAYNSAGFLVNAVYIARAEDSIQSVSQKVFGSDQQQEQLYAINPHLKRRPLKTGDKIYYPSPHRPQDSNQLLFYFEDKGIPPQYHQVRAGENIRQVASSLLGHKDSWKEVWATNLELESKGVLNQDLTIKYWPEGADNRPTEPAATEPSATNNEEAELSPSTETAEETHPFPEEDSPPQPPAEENEYTDEESPADLPDNEGEESKASSPSAQGFSQTDIAIAGILALSALILCAIIVKRKWKKKADFDYTNVNYEINE